MSVVLLRGVPGSGKTTAALQLMNDYPDQFVRVNRDDIRMMMYGEYWFSGDDANTKEKAVTQVEHSLIKSAIKAGKRPLVDATNLNKQSVKAILRIAGSHGMSVDHIDFEVSQEEAIRRDAGRAKKVGEDVIKKFFQKNNIDKVSGKLPAMPEVPSLNDREFVKYSEPDNELALPTCVLVDIDGTIAHMTGRSPYDYSRVSEDAVDEVIERLVGTLHRDGYEIIFFSGRKDSSKEDTKKWLIDNVDPSTNFQLFMRPADDDRPDYVVKYEMFHEHIQGKYHVEFVIDDRLQVCRMWHKLGVKVVRVGDPDADF